MPKYNYQYFVLDLSAAGKEKIEIEGGHVYIKDATDTVANVDVQVDDNTADKVNLVRKTGIIARFKTLFLSWAAQPGKTLTLLISSAYEDFRVMEQQIGDVNVVNASLDVNVLNGSIPVTSASALTTKPETVSGVTVGQLTLAVANTAYQIVAANANRKRLRVHNTNTSWLLMVGPTNAVTYANGYYVGLHNTPDFVMEGYTGALWGVTNQPGVVITFMEET